MIRWTDTPPLGREPKCRRCRRVVFGPAVWQASTLLAARGTTVQAVVVETSCWHRGCASGLAGGGAG